MDWILLLGLFLFQPILATRNMPKNWPESLKMTKKIHFHPLFQRFLLKYWTFWKTVFLTIFFWKSKRLHVPEVVTGPINMVHAKKPHYNVPVVANLAFSSQKKSKNGKKAAFCNTFASKLWKFFTRTRIHQSSPNFQA